MLYDVAYKTDTFERGTVRLEAETLFDVHAWADERGWEIEEAAVVTSPGARAAEPIRIPSSHLAAGTPEQHVPQTQHDGPKLLPSEGVRGVHLCITIALAVIVCFLGFRLYEQSGKSPPPATSTTVTVEAEAEIISLPLSVDSPRVQWLVNRLNQIRGTRWFKAEESTYRNSYIEVTGLDGPTWMIRKSDGEILTLTFNSLFKRYEPDRPIGNIFTINPQVMPQE